MAQNSNLLTADQAAAIYQEAAQNSNIAADAQASEIFKGVSLEANDSTAIEALSSH